MKGTYGSRLDNALKMRRKSRKELAKCLDISVQAIGQVINGPTVALTAENHEKAARFLRVNGYWLATGEGDSQPLPAGWPFPKLDAAKVLNLSREDLIRVETLLLREARHEGIDLAVDNSISTQATM